MASYLVYLVSPSVPERGILGPICPLLCRLQYFAACARWKMELLMLIMATFASFDHVYLDFGFEGLLFGAIKAEVMR